MNVNENMLHIVINLIVPIGINWYIYIYIYIYIYHVSVIYLAYFNIKILNI